MSDPFAEAGSLAGSGRLREALSRVDLALAATPRHAGAMALKAALLSETGEPSAAAALFERAAALDPRNPSLLSNWGNALAKLGQLDEAAQRYDQALALDPDHGLALCNRAAVLTDLGRAADALADADRALVLRPSLAPALMQRGRALQALGRNAEAEQAFASVLAQRPDHASAHLGRGTALHSQMRFDEALDSLDRAAALRPGDADILRQRGMTLLNLRRREAALADLDAARAASPAKVRIHIDRAVILNALGRFEDGLAALDEAVALTPDAPLPLLRRAQARLRLGDFSAGWRDHEHRWREPAFIAQSSGYVTPAVRTRLDPNVTRNDLAGRRVLAVAEQGVGDQIMFASMLPDLAADAGEVVCLCDPRLIALARHSLPGINFAGPAPFPDPDAFDHVIALGSLGRLYRNSGADFPATAYLRPRQEAADAWRERLGPRTAPRRIGLSWRGGLPTTSGPWRSLALESLLPLLCRQDCEFVSLQYGDAAAEVSDANAGLDRPIRRFPAEDIDDFEQLAGLVQALDLVISVQTALIHLCGAIGAPCQVMVPFAPEWRYGCEGPSMPWYGSVRLVRQPQPDDWDSVLRAIGAELDALP